jgi:hypothetical protein
MNLYIDTETIPTQRDDLKAYIFAKQAMKAAQDPEPDPVKARNAAQAAYRDTSLSSTMGELAVVSIAIDDNEPITFTRRWPFTIETERELVDAVATELRGTLETVGARRNLRHIVAHKADFDRTMLRTRAMVHGVKLPHEIHALGLKPWDSAWFCTHDALKLDYRDHVSLDSACLAFGVGLPKGDIDGSKVWEAIQAGRLDQVAAYCADDVRRVRAIYRAITAVR